MPVYEFVCRRCRQETTRILKIADRNVVQQCEKKVAVYPDHTVEPPEYVSVEHADVGFVFHPEGVPEGVTLQVQYCEGLLERVEMPSSLTVDTEGSYTCGAILADGTKVPGHFGKDAHRRKPRYGKYG